MHQSTELRTQLRYRARTFQIAFAIALTFSVASSLTGAAVATPILGSYPDISLPLSTDTTVTPDAAPTDTTSINVSTSTDFKGTFTADRKTGVVWVTDAHSAGTYRVTVTAFDRDTATKTFTLTVTTPVTCLPVSFARAVNYVTGNDPESIAVGDFDSDGNQDLAVADGASDVVAILSGDGAGNFNKYPRLFLAGDNAASVAVGDFNGNGKQDLSVANRNSDTVSVLSGNGRGRCLSSQPTSALTLERLALSRWATSMATPGKTSPLSSTLPQAG